ncbi:MAG: glycosyltransferase family 4 protein [Firmicutes bacterium]|nr:glycosyltransferase family 4 protein [Bacillota bacterium]
MCRQGQNIGMEAINLRVLQVSGPAAGGIKKHIRQLAAGLYARGVEVRIAPPGPVSPLTMAALIRDIREGGVDLVHCHGFQGGVNGRLAALVAGVPAVVTIHNSLQVKGLYTRGALWAEGCLRRRTARWVAVSSWLRDWSLATLGLPESGIEVIYNGIELTPLPDFCPRPVVGTVARLIHGKGIDVLLRALALLRRDLPNVRGLIVGDGPERPKLELLSRELGLESVVKFTGHVDDVGGYLRRMGVFVLPTRSEGLGISIMEAMTQAVPVVATAVGGVPELVVDGKTGLLVPADAPGRLALAIKQILTSRALAQRLTVGAWEHLQARFALDAMISGNYQLYRRVIDA